MRSSLFIAILYNTIWMIKWARIYVRDKESVINACKM
jgi:hypothetical protein